MAKKKLLLCADDFGISPGVSQAILDLVKLKRISATSCMTGMPAWSSVAAELKPHRGEIQIGLHLTLTDQTSCGPLPTLAPNGRLPKLGRLVNLAVLRRLDMGEIADEVQRQFDAFYLGLDHAPDFIDGHQHVHQLPVVRDAILETIRKNGLQENIWVRVCWESPSRLIMRRHNVARALAIGIFGLPLMRQLKRHQIRFNPGFTGIYDFDHGVFDDGLMESFLKNAADETLMVCHPGIVDEELKSHDSLLYPRETEYEYFRDETFLEFLDSHGFQLAGGRTTNGLGKL